MDRSMEAISQSSVWIRPLRLLFQSGSPLSPIVYLTLELPGQTVPIGAATETQRGRLIFWPALPGDGIMVTPNGQPALPDHVTLELSSGKCHLTSIDANGNRDHMSRQWSLYGAGNGESQFWFHMIFKTEMLLSQQDSLDFWVQSPPSDLERRKAEIQRHAERARHIKLKAATIQGDYVWCALYISAGDNKKPSVPEETLRFDAALNGLVNGWPEGNSAVMCPNGGQVGGSSLMILIGGPEGEAQQPVALGFLKKAQGV